MIRPVYRFLTRTFDDCSQGLSPLDNHLLFIILCVCVLQDPFKTLFVGNPCKYITYNPSLQSSYGLHPRKSSKMGKSSKMDYVVGIKGGLSLNVENPYVMGRKSHISFVKHNSSKEVKKSKQLTINEVF